MTQRVTSSMQTLARVKVKVCGMTQAKQVHELVNLGVDAIGVILHANSPRLISLRDAQRIRDEIPAFVSMVGVFVDCEIETVNNYIDQIGLDLVQLHGAETNEYASSLHSPFIKAIRAHTSDQVNRDVHAFPNARALLLDPYVKGQHGGTGQQLDATTWPSDEVQPSVTKKLILAGGLSKQNLVTSVQRFQPYAVDLNSGVEYSPGDKNIDLVGGCLSLLGR